MKFTKMHGLGNDYVYINCMESMPENLPELARRLSDRHFGVGGDGLICVCPSDHADARMAMYNADGSEGEMCGNGLRCLGKFLYDKGIVDSDTITVETRAGIKTLTVKAEHGRAVSLAADMGVPEVFEQLPLQLDGVRYDVTPVSMGNPHAVLFRRDIDTLDLAVIGPKIERHRAFPNRTNVEFVAIRSASELSMRVWERGSGETLACGTGACAALAAAVSLGYVNRTATVHLPGGALALDWRADGRMFMTGPAVTVYEGELDHL